MSDVYISLENSVIHVDGPDSTKEYVLSGPTRLSPADARRLYESLREVFEPPAKLSGGVIAVARPAIVELMGRVRIAALVRRAIENSAMYEVQRVDEKGSVGKAELYGPCAIYKITYHESMDALMKEHPDKPFEPSASSYYTDDFWFDEDEWDEMGGYDDDEDALEAALDEEEWIGDDEPYPDEEDGEDTRADDEKIPF